MKRKHENNLAFYGDIKLITRLKKNKKIKTKQSLKDQEIKLIKENSNLSRNQKTITS